MALIDSLSPTLGAINALVVGMFGSRVTVYRVTQAKRADKSVGKTYAADNALTNVSVLMLTPEQAARKQLFGLTETAEAMLLIPQQSGALPTINQLDGFKFTSGPYANQLFIAETAGYPDAVGMNVQVSVVSAPEGTVMA